MKERTYWVMGGLLSAALMLVQPLQTTAADIQVVPVVSGTPSEKAPPRPEHLASTEQPATGSPGLSANVPQPQVPPATGPGVERIATESQVPPVIPAAPAAISVNSVPEGPRPQAENSGNTGREGEARNGTPVKLPFSLDGNGFPFQAPATTLGDGEDIRPEGSGQAEPDVAHEPHEASQEPADPENLESLSVSDIVAEDESTEREAGLADGAKEDTEDAKLVEGVAEGETEQDLPSAGTAEEVGEPEGVAPDAVVSEKALPPPHSRDGDEFDFPSSPGIERQKIFWIEIFTRYNSLQGVLHDGRIALPVYESVELAGMSYRNQMRAVRQQKRVLTNALRELAVDLEAGNTLDEAQQALLAKLPKGSTPEDIRDFAGNVRFQRGLADRFRKGIIRSGALMDHMRASMERHSVPTDLVYLPHVESTYNNATRSKAGAVGIWQFTRGTGKRYMTVGYEVDERLDPLVAGEAAAKFLRKNYEALGTWPLAITAYNHGPNSLRRITKRLGSKDLGYLIENYNGRLFKFASKNFYAEFLAAREVGRNPQAYFGDLELEEPWRHVMLPELTFYLDVERAAMLSGVSLEVLRKFNPALRSSIWSGTKLIPKGYQLRLPADAVGKGAEENFLAKVPERDQHKTQKRSEYVRVGRGDSLYSIGRRLGISWRKIAHANNISSYHRLMPGQKLIIPWDGKNLDALRAKLVVERNVSQPTPPKIIAQVPVRTEEELQAAAKAGAAGPSSQFQELRIVNFNEKRKDGEIVTAYGETLGKYAEWAQVPIWEIRRLNGMSSRRSLSTGTNLLIPLDQVSREVFDQRRLAFHSEREASFFAEYNITSKVTVEVRPGQSPWNLAQQNNVPMWLFYKENPALLKAPLRAGMLVILPVVVAGVR